MTIQTRTTDRKAMANALASELSVQAEYLGMPTCAYRVGSYTVNWDGSIDGEDTDAIRSFLLRSGFLSEETEPGADDPGTPIQGEAETIPEDDRMTVMNVSIPVQTWTTQGVLNLIRTLYARQKLINAMTRNDTVFIDDEVQDLLKDEKPESVKRIQEILDTETGAGMIRGIKLADGHLTVDFPSFTRNPEHWAACSSLIIAAADRAKAQKFTNVSLISPEDSEMKYFCRSWLIQLGFGGAEHKDTRHILLDHLHGFAAFRTADKMNAHKARMAERRAERKEADSHDEN